MLLGFNVPKLLNTRAAHAETAKLAPLADLVSPYILLDLETKWFLYCADKNKDSYFVRSRCIYCKLNAAVKIKPDKDSAVCNRPSQLSAALPYVMYHYLNHISLAVSNITFYTMQERWTSFTQNALHMNKLPDVFQAPPSIVAIALGVKRPSFLVTVFIDVESVIPRMFITDVIGAVEFPTSSHALYMTIAAPVRKRQNQAQ